MSERKMKDTEVLKTGPRPRASDQVVGTEPSPGLMQRKIQRRALQRKADTKEAAPAKKEPAKQEGGDGKVKSTGGTKPVERLATAPKTDAQDIISLVDAAKIPAELAKADAHYVHLIASGKDVYLNLGDPPDRTVLTSLTKDLLGPDGEVQQGLDAKTFFTLEGNDVVAGKAKENATFGAGTRSADDVLKSSNEKSNVIGSSSTDPLGEKMDQVWDIMNGGRTELNKKDLPADHQVGKEKKDASWYNGIQIHTDPETGAQTVQVERTALDNRTDPLPELSIDEYRQMLIRDFDYNGAITQFKELGGLTAFVKAVLARYPDQDPKTMTVVATEVWSYATTGMDTKGVTDIAQMQGYLYALDPSIKVSSDTNTLMGAEFNAGTKEKPIMLKGGDGKHGRATILTTRHLLSNVTFEKFQPQRIATEEKSIFQQFDDRDRFIRDNSGSMAAKWSDATGTSQTTIVGGVDKTLGRGAFDPTGQNASIGQNIDATFGGNTEGQLKIPNAGANANLDRRGQVIDFSKVLEDAYDRIYPLHRREDAVAFATLFKLQDKISSIFTKERSDKGEDKYLLDGKALRMELGDVDPNDPDKAAAGESSFKAIIATLLYAPQYTEEALKDLKPEERPRLNAVADEQEQSPEYLELAKQLSQEMNIDVRIIATPTYASNFNPETDIAVIDLQSMKMTELDPTVSQSEAYDQVAVSTVTFDCVIGGVKQTKTVEVKKFGYDVRKERTGQQKHYQRSGTAYIEGQDVVSKRQ